MGGAKAGLPESGGWRVGGDLLDRLAATDRLHGDPGLELGTVSAALAHGWEPPFRGGAPTQRLTIGAVQESQSTLLWLQSDSVCASFSRNPEFLP